jgi:hypothetical protein
LSDAPPEEVAFGFFGAFMVDWATCLSRIESDRALLRAYSSRPGSATGVRRKEKGWWKQIDSTAGKTEEIFVLGL